MPQIIICRAEPMIGSPAEDRAQELECRFVCSDTQPDAEFLLRKVLSERNCQPVGILEIASWTDQNLLDYDRFLFDIFLLRGQALAIVEMGLGS
jgi:hypothetical protein